jgi:hypothetical protein
MGSWPNFGYPYPGIFDRLNDRGGNNQPKNYLGVNGGVGGLMPWIRVLSSLGVSGPEASDGGLILQSNYPSDGFSSRYGTGYGSSGIVGYEFDMKTPLKVKGRPSRPSPIVSNLNIDESDVGRKKITFSITCYTLEHMEAIAKYFVEPGFYVLVEWGWNTKKAQQQWAGNWANDGKGEVTPCQMAQYAMWNHIKSKREASQFTYDAALGLVTNSGIKFGDNETYIFDVTLTSLGEVAEYMQSHKSTPTADVKLESSLSFEPDEISTSEKDSEVSLGQSLFKQMFNELPGHKRTSEIKSWVDKSLGQPGTMKVPAFVDFELDQICPTDIRWDDQSSYMNMDKTIVSGYIDSLKKGETLSKANGKDLQVPSDQPFLSKERFIRFELAVDILNKISAIQEENSLCGKAKNANRLRIDIDSTICGAFPQMYSANEKTLYIPNPKAPLFNLTGAFSGKKDVSFLDLSTLGEETQNLHPRTSSTKYTGTREKNGASTPHAFPSQYELKVEDNKWECDDSMISYTKPKEWWGWLKNLYINFDFFCAQLDSSNFTVKDVLVECLNGMSSAVNSHWQFEITSGPKADDGTNTLRVVDKNFTDTRNIDISKINENRLQSRGLKSPFIDFTFETTTPAAMQNSIIQKRLNNESNVEPHPELGVVAIRGGVFSEDIDMVATIVSNIKYKASEVESTEESSNEPVTPKKEPTKDENRTKNFEAFMKYAGVFVKAMDRAFAEESIDEMDDFAKNPAFTKLDELFVVGTWRDTNLLKKIQLINKGQNSELYGDKEKESQAQSAFGTAQITFKVHGVSGFKRGDVLRFDGLPKQFSDPHFWEVKGMEHSIAQDGWYTSITCGMRTNGTVKSGK